MQEEGARGGGPGGPARASGGEDRAGRASVLRHVSVRGDGAVPPGRQLERQLAVMVREGRLGPGRRLPSTRRLASRIGLHRNTVAAAFRRLADRGLVAVRHGARAEVAAAAGRPVDPVRAAPADGVGSGGGGAECEPAGRRAARVLAAASEEGTARLMAAELSAALPRPVRVEPAVVGPDGTRGRAGAGSGAGPGDGRPGGEAGAPEIAVGGLVVALPGPAARAASPRAPEGTNPRPRIRARQDVRAAAVEALRAARPLDAVAVLTACPRLREALLCDAARIRPGEPIACVPPPGASDAAAARALRPGAPRDAAAGADLVIADRPSAEALCGGRPQDGAARPVPARLLSRETLAVVARAVPATDARRGRADAP